MPNLRIYGGSTFRIYAYSSIHPKFSQHVWINSTFQDFLKVEVQLLIDKQSFKSDKVAKEFILRKSELAPDKGFDFIEREDCGHYEKKERRRFWRKKNGFSFLSLGKKRMS